MNRNLLLLIISLGFSIIMNLPRFELIFILDVVSFRTITDIITENPFLHFFSILGFCFVGIKLNLQWIHLFVHKNKRSLSIALNSSLFLLWIFLFFLANNLFRSLDVLASGFLFASVYLSMLVVIIIISKTIYLEDKAKANALEKEKLKHENLQNELSALKNQLNPHFLFNSLNSLLFLVREDQKNAEKFIKKLSYLYRYTLQSADNDYVSLEQELKFLESFVYLLQSRYKDNLQVLIKLNDQDLNYRIPSLSLQILVENAVKHNSISSAMPLTIEIYREENFLFVKNRIQKRTGGVVSTLTGLENLNSRFLLLVNQNIEIKEDEFFTVKMPIQ